MSTRETSWSARTSLRNHRNPQGGAFGHSDDADFSDAGDGANARSQQHTTARKGKAAVPTRHERSTSRARKLVQATRGRQAGRVGLAGSRNPAGTDTGPPHAPSQREERHAEGALPAAVARRALRAPDRSLSEQAPTIPTRRDESVYGWSKRGERCFATNGKNGIRITSIATIDAPGMGDCFLVCGSTDRAVFEASFKRVMKTHDDIGVRAFLV